MSMSIDLSKALTPAERTYLAMRGRYDDITRSDQMHGFSPQALPEGDGSGPVAHGTSAADRLQQEVEELKRQLALLTGSTAVSEEADVAPYEEWTVAELDAELKRRTLAVTGNKDAKVKVLYQDDEANGS